MVLEMQYPNLYLFIYFTFKSKIDIIIRGVKTPQ